MVTHEPHIAARAHRTLRIRDGLLEADTPTGALDLAGRQRDKGFYRLSRI